MYNVKIISKSKAAPAALLLEIVLFITNLPFAKYTGGRPLKVQNILNSNFQLPELHF